MLAWHEHLVRRLVDYYKVLTLYPVQFLSIPLLLLHIYSLKIVNSMAMLV